MRWLWNMAGGSWERQRRLRCRLWALALVALSGCQAIELDGPNRGVEQVVGGPGDPNYFAASVPTEKDKTALPTYTIEPPDILIIQLARLVPKPPYRVEPLDVLEIAVVRTLRDQPIADRYSVDPSGMIDLGPSYGKVKVAGMTLDEAETAIDKHLRKVLKEPEVSVTLFQSAGQQQIEDEHLVGPDGTVNLGTYGKVYVSGMTLGEAETVIEAQLSKFLEKPDVSVDVFAYNSKVYYIITEGAGQGDRVVRVAATGNETVLDAISQINGLSQLSSKKIWIARPGPGGLGCDQILPVNWVEITKGAATATNYQVLPGDRVFIAENKLIKLDTVINVAIAPFERILGFSLLGSQAIQTFNRFPEGQNQGGF